MIMHVRLFSLTLFVFASFKLPVGCSMEQYLRTEWNVLIFHLSFGGGGGLVMHSNDCSLFNTDRAGGRIAGPNMSVW